MSRYILFAYTVSQLIISKRGVSGRRLASEGMSHIALGIFWFCFFVFFLFCFVFCFFVLFCLFVCLFVLHKRVFTLTLRAHY